LRLDGWPTKRVEHWRRNAWVCPWLGRAGDLLEPCLSLPSIIVSGWLFVLLHQLVTLRPGIALGLAAIPAVFILSVFCFVWVRWQGTDEEERS
jgi:hypothetical protein